jgi:hypothetical protein
MLTEITFFCLFMLVASMYLGFAKLRIGSMRDLMFVQKYLNYVTVTHT